MTKEDAKVMWSFIYQRKDLLIAKPFDYFNKNQYNNSISKKEKTKNDNRRKIVKVKESIKAMKEIEKLEKEVARLKKNIETKKLRLKSQQKVYNIFLLNKNKVTKSLAPCG